MHPPKAKPYLHRQERAASGIGLHVNAQKTEYMSFNQTGDNSTQNGSSLELFRQVHLPRKQCLIDRDRHLYATNKGMGTYQ